MNAINHSEVQAIETANEEMVIPEQSSIVVPLSQLRVSKRNVRKIRSSGPSIDALAASIARVGLLQNLTVVQARDGKYYDVVAGGRRLADLKQLAKSGRIPKEWAVPCMLVASADTRTVSLTAHSPRRAIHPERQV